MHLVRDLLDNQVTDERHRKMGKVDGIVLVLRQGRPPRVAAIELGMSTLLCRISDRLGHFAARLERRLGITDGTPVRIPLDKIESVGIDVRVNINADRTTVYDWEHWIDRVFIERIPIPGAGSGEPEAEEKGGKS
jgi:sporulation protein YlmC with PRC-barrel domain